MRKVLILGALFTITLLVFGGKEKEGRKKTSLPEDGVNPRHPSGFRPPSSLPERIVKSLKRKFFEPEESLRDQSTKRKRVEPSISVTAQPSPLKLEEMHELERKWQAVCEFRVRQALGQTSLDVADEIGAKWDVGGGRNVYLLLQKLISRGTLLRQPGSGRPRMVSGREDVQQYFLDQSFDWDHTWTYEAMANALKNEFGVGSSKTVKALFDQLEFRKARRQVRPFLKPHHMQARMAWAKEWKDFDFERDDTVVLHLDEKWFYAFSARGKVAYLPPGVDPKPYYALSKTHIPHVMFLGVVGAPREEHGFDGKIGLYHVGEEYEAKITSKYHQAGDVYWVNVNMDGKIFMDMVEHRVIPDIRKKCSWAKRVIVQIDSAGGHRIGESLDYLNGVGSKGRLKIEFRTQPANSPDTNVMDLGIWRSMQSRVVEVKFVHNAEKNMHQRIIDAVNEMWADYDPDVLSNIFDTLKLVLEKIEENDGGNSFKLPHAVKDPEC
jgi:transposase